MEKYTAKMIAEDASGEPGAAFRYFDKRDVAAFGRYLVFSDVRWPLQARFSGYPACLAWLLIHLLLLAGLLTYLS
jgi:NADH dehydrogenase FAD-containing subunit